jgi:5-methylcytosine-specific restriction endonuclease McrA
MRESKGKKVIHKKKKVVANPRVPRTRNNQTMTESQFFSWIRNNFRRMSMYWKPITAAKQKARKQVIGKRHKFEYQCANCTNWFLDKEVEVDHVIEAGSLRSFSDLSGFAERLFTEDIDNLVVLCKPCHKDKTHR